MKVLGITGGIGMGKSACAELVRARGIRVIDTDELARAVVEPGQPALTEIQRVFGAGVIGPDGRLLRGKLAARVFSDREALRQLESILHPRIRDLWTAEVAALARAVRSSPLPQTLADRLVAVVIPLLFETRAEQEVDFTLCVACSAATQFQRLRARGWSDAQIQQRLQAQWPSEKKIHQAHFVIWSEGSLEIHSAQLEHILRHLPS